MPGAPSSVLVTSSGASQDTYLLMKVKWDAHGGI